MKKIAFIPKHWGESQKILNQLNLMHHSGASFDINDADLGKVVVIEERPKDSSGWVIVDDAEPDKEEALILDYAGNIERFFPDGNLFNPQIQAYGQKPKIKETFVCPLCNNDNLFTLRPNPDGMTYDAEGYFLSLDGTRFEPITPAHYGRRCQFVHERGLNNFERCTHFWECKMCECGQDNDIAARKCSACGKLLIDYNDKLIGKFLDFKNDLSQVQTDEIDYFSKKQMTSKTGNPMLRVTFSTKYRKFVAFFSNRVNRRFYEMMSDASFRPQTVSYKKSSKTDFYTVVDFNRKADEE